MVSLDTDTRLWTSALRRELFVLGVQEKVKQVQHHFLLNQPIQRYDAFHMILHSVWLRRLNIRLDLM